MLYDFRAQMAQEIVDDMTQNTDLYWYLNEHLEMFNEEVIAYIGKGITDYIRQAIKEIEEDTYWEVIEEVMKKECEAVMRGNEANDE